MAPFVRDLKNLDPFYKNMTAALAVRTRRACIALMTLLLLVGGVWPETGTADDQVFSPVALHLPALPNAYRIHPQVISGGLPENPAGFAALQQLGVKTIISVDGAVPEIDAAARYGLRYVHLPHGYDGISDQRQMELAKAVRDLPSPIYIHCHHGKHRSPTAAATACVLAGLMPPPAAVQVLRVAGTGANYRGLYATAQRARPASKVDLDQLQVQFVPIAKLPPMAEAMVAIEHHLDHLQQLAQNQWQPLANHPDLSAAHEALLLREQYTELLRLEDTARRGPPFVTHLRASQQLALRLEETLNQPTAVAGISSRATEQLKAVANDCKQCHAAHRD